MKGRMKRFWFVAVGTVLICSIWISAGLHSARLSNDKLLFETFCDGTGSFSWHFVIYLDVKACLACTEDMEAWKELERRLPGLGGKLSIWTSRVDSVDVFWAMKLEGMNSEVRVLESDVLARLDWGGIGTPVKVLLDYDCRQVKIAGRMGNTVESEQFIQTILDQICTVDKSGM